MRPMSLEQLYAAYHRQFLIRSAFSTSLADITEQGSEYGTIYKFTKHRFESIERLNPSASPAAYSAAILVEKMA
jgi:hypothetical protein